MKLNNKKLAQGFTLIEVLLALAIIAIALTALLKATGENVSSTTRIKNKTISHWIAMQGITAVQAGMVNTTVNQDTTHVTKLLGQQWYWRVHISTTAIPGVQQINIGVSQKQAGPFNDPLIGFKFQL